MSLESWKAEFYPKDADQYKEKSDKKCIKAAIKKWKGALPENCEKHNVRYVYYSICDDINNTELNFDDSTCSLCVKYPEAFCHRMVSEVIMQECPIIRMRGHACDRPLDGEDSVYKKSINNPKPILKLLKETLRFVKDNPED